MSNSRSSSVVANNQDNAIPSFSVLPQSATISAGTDSHLISCQAQGTPTPTILWKFEDDVIPTGTNKYELTAEGLVLHDPKRMDTGKYTCVARNPHGTESASADITVTGERRFRSWLESRFLGGNLIERGPTNQSILIGTTLEIPCEVNPDFRAQAQIMWFINVSIFWWIVTVIRCFRAILSLPVEIPASVSRGPEKEASRLAKSVPIALESIRKL